MEYSEKLVGRPLNSSYSEVDRFGDHIWLISDIRKFQPHYSDGRMNDEIERITCKIHDGPVDRLKTGTAH